MKSIDDAYKYFRPKLVDIEKYCKSDFWIAGGALTNFFLTGQNSSDTDLFFSSKEDIKNVNRNFLTTNASEISFYFVQKGITFNVIKQPYETIEDVLESFDFVCCCSAINKNTFHHHDRYFNSLEKKIAYINDFNNIKKDTVLLRFHKYIKKGFSFRDQDVINMNNIINGKEITTIENMERSRPIIRQRTIEPQQEPSPATLNPTPLIQFMERYREETNRQNIIQQYGYRSLTGFGTIGGTIE